MGVEICLDAGSTHMGKKKYAEELIKRAKDSGADHIKFQMFPNEKEYTSTGNVHIGFEFFKECLSYGAKHEMSVTTSVFDGYHLEDLVKLKLPFIKFGYSQRNHWNKIMGCLEIGKEVIVSCGVMDEIKDHPRLKKLYCIPQYPVPFKVDFEGLFPRFDGFSDHTLGIHQTLDAMKAGAKFIEKHVTLKYADITCPDSRFAITFDQVKKLTEKK